jgi:hypothetical protein
LPRSAEPFSPALYNTVRCSAIPYIQTNPAHRSPARWGQRLIGDYPNRGVQRGAAEEPHGKGTVAANNNQHLVCLTKGLPAISIPVVAAVGEQGLDGRALGLTTVAGVD